MRSKVLILLIFLFTISIALADEHMPALKAGGETYSNVTITSVSATDVYFTSDQGMANVKLKNLSPELQEHFKFNAAKVAAAETEKQQQAEQFKTAHAANAGNPQTIDNSNAKFIMEDAQARVREIVNQPVRQLAETHDMKNVGTSAFWFHDGADKPDYNNVDVHTTQDLQYARYPFFTSDMNPGVVFPGGEIEFNSMTKYYYTDRHLPKKKLTDAEMTEINRLYRIIGRCEDVLYFSKDPRLAQDSPQTFLVMHKKEIIGGIAAVLVILIMIRIRAKTVG